MNFAVIIVLYYPDSRLDESIKTLTNIDLVEKIYLIDNTPNFKYNLKSSYKIKYTFLNTNTGIGNAQNIGMEFAKNDGFDWVMTLDQDTIVTKELFIKYKLFLKNVSSNVALINSDYYDINCNCLKYNNNKVIEVNEVISSGSLLNVSIFFKVGMMKKEYIIDLVDNEFCYRLIKNGYKICVLPNKGFEHRLGNIKKCSFMGREIHIYNQSPIRTFYRTRNSVWFSKQYKEKRRDITISLIKDFFKILFENDKICKYKMFFIGLIHGVFFSEGKAI